MTQQNTWEERFDMKYIKGELEIHVQGTGVPLKELKSFISQEISLAEDKLRRKIKGEIEKYKDFVIKEKGENLERENIMIAYDMDSRYVACKQILSIPLLKTNKPHQHISDGLVYTSNPPQNKCIECGEFYR